jgi:hypothetical protein
MACKREKEGAYTRYGWEKSEAKRKLGRPRRRWKGNIKMSFQDIEYGIYSTGSEQE